MTVFELPNTSQRTVSLRRYSALVLGTAVLLCSFSVGAEPKREIVPMDSTVGMEVSGLDSDERRRPPIVNPQLTGLLAILAGVSQSR